MKSETSVYKVIGWVITGILGFVAFIGILLSFNIIDAQERGVVTRFGSVNRVWSEGLHFKVPFVESVTKMDISVQAYPVIELAYSKDTQTVSTEVTLNYHLNPGAVDKVFKDVREDYKDRLITPAIKEAIKAVTSKYTAQGLIDNRPQVSIDVKNSLLERLTERGFIIDNVSITNLDFDDAYENAVKEKQVAEQNAQKQINVTKQEEEKKKQEILKAEALAEKTRLESAALASLNGEKVIAKIYAEAALKAAEKWNGALPTQMIPGQTLPFIQLGK